MSERLKNLGKRELIGKAGSYRWQHLLVPDVNTPKAQFGYLLERSKKVYARPISEIAAEIEARKPKVITDKEILDDWQ
jgi:hypothetical protein